MFKKPATWLVLLAFLGSLAGCTGDSVTITTPTSEGSPVIKNINPLQADELIKTNKDNTNFVILDVRTPSEYIEGHLKNSVNLDYNAADFKDKVNNLNKNKTYLVYCRTSNRSASAVKIMAELGFKDIFHMTGGIVEWQASGLPVVK
jgi:rhodanese-related sulfurtransferase